MEFPEHDKLRDYRRSADILTEFVEWLESEGIQFDFDNAPDGLLEDRKPRRLIHKFLEVDEAKLAEEKELMGKSF